MNNCPLCLSSGVPIGAHAYRCRSCGESFRDDSREAGGDALLFADAEHPLSIESDPETLSA